MGPLRSCGHGVRIFLIGPVKAFVSNPQKVIPGDFYYHLREGNSLHYISVMSRQNECEQSRQMSDTSEGIQHVGMKPQKR